MIELDNLKKALEADSWCQECGQEHIRPAIEQLIKALEQPTQEAVAYQPTSQEQSVMHQAMIRSSKLVHKATSPSREWQSLSDYLISELWYKSQNDIEGVNLGFTTQEHFFAGLIDANLREKND